MVQPASKRLVTEATLPELAQDAAAALIAAGTYSGITFAYDDAGNRLSATVTPSAVADATTTTKGALQLGGDLGGTAAAPTVPGLANKVNSSTYTAGLAGKVDTLTPTSVKTAAYTAAVSDLVPVDATSSAVTITLPTAPADKARVTVKKIDIGTNVVTVATAGSDVLNKAGGSTSVALTLPNQAATFQYSATNAIWYLVGSDLPLTQLDARFAAAGSTGSGAVIDDTSTAANRVLSASKVTTLLSGKQAAGDYLPRSEYTAGGGNVPTATGTIMSRVYAGFARRDTAGAVVVGCGSSTAGGQGATSDPRQIVVRTVIGLQTDYPLSSGAAQPTTKDISVAAGTTPPPGIQHVKAAISGANSGTYLTDTMAAQIGALNPVLVLHIVGSNDYSINRPPATVRADMLSWANKIDAAVTNGTKPVHAAVFGHRRLNVSNPTYPWSAYGAVFADLAASYPSQWIFMNLYAAYTKVGQDTGGPYPFMDADNIHMNDAGHAFGADMLRAILREALQLNSATPSGADPVTPSDTTAPTVSSFTATPGTGQVALAWAGTDNVGITRWLLKRGTTTIYDGTATSYTDTGLTNGSAYSYTVQAFDAAGNSTTSSTVTATPTAAADTTAPSTPTNFAAGTPTSSSVPLSWTASTDNVAVTGYKVRRGGTLVASPTTTSYTDSGLSAATAYSYTVSAIDAAGNESAQTSAVSVTTATASGVADMTTGMLWDFDADTIALADGAAVPSWTSQGGSLATAPVVAQGTAGNRPSYVLAQNNGHNAVRFTSSASTRLLSTDLNNPVVPGTSVSYVYVIKRTGASTRLIGGANSSGYHTLADPNSANGFIFGIEALSGNVLTYTTSILNRWIVIIVSAAGASSKLVVNNETPITGTLNTSNGVGISIGGSGSGTGYGTFDLAKYRAYDHALTDTEINNLRTYLSNRYTLA